MDREHRSFYAEAEESKQESSDQKRKVAVYLGRAQAASRHKQKASMLRQNDHTHKGQRCAAHGIQQVFQTRITSDLVHVMHDQRQRTQCQQLVKEIHGNHVCCKCDAKDDTIGHRKEGKESVLSLLMLHIFKSVKVRDGPQNSDDRRKHGR